MQIICSVHGVTVFWDVTPCILFGSDERFGGIFCPTLPVKDGGRIPTCPKTRKKEVMHFSTTFLFISSSSAYQSVIWSADL
jgi:hypothetical protein